MVWYRLAGLRVAFLRWFAIWFQPPLLIAERESFVEEVEMKDRPTGNLFTGLLLKVICLQWLFAVATISKLGGLNLLYIEFFFEKGITERERETGRDFLHFPFLFSLLHFQKLEFLFLRKQNFLFFFFFWYLRRKAYN